MSEDAFSSTPASRLCLPDIKGVEVLVELAPDLRWSWNHCTDDIWQQLDPALWARTQNPWIVLQPVGWPQWIHRHVRAATGEQRGAGCITFSAPSDQADARRVSTSRIAG